jgi:hypothetical protein
MYFVPEQKIGIAMANKKLPFLLPSSGACDPGATGNQLLLSSCD